MRECVPFNPYLKATIEPGLGSIDSWMLPNCPKGFFRYALMPCRHWDLYSPKLVGYPIAKGKALYSGASEERLRSWLMGDCLSKP